MTDPASPIRNILFAPAAGPGVGGGHLMRCLTLAMALRDRGAVCTFSVNDAGAALLERFGGGAFAVHRRSIGEALARSAFDALVIDDYGVSAPDQRIWREHVRRLVIVDDLADRPHLADILLDPGYGRIANDYDGLAPDGAVRLIGPKFALVRPDVVAHRPIALNRPIAEKPRRLFVSFGLSDVGGVTGRAVAAIRNRLATVDIDVALPSGAESAAKLKALASADFRLHLHFDALNVADLMVSADMAVGAGGTSTWERCCLGTPSLAVIVADNQRSTIQALAKEGVLLTVELDDPGFDALFDDALSRLCQIDVRNTLRARSFELCDGGGAGRAADAILAV